MSTKRLFTLLFILALFAMTVRETLDADMWWHLRTGEAILDSGIPRQDLFSFTVPENDWTTHEWLSQVLMWVFYQSSGLVGLMLFFALLTTSALAIVYLRCDGKPYLAAFVILAAALASAPFWGVRPQVFNILFAAFFVFLVEGFKDGKLSRTWLWLLPLLTVIWANLHSGYLLGIAILGAYVVGEAMQLIVSTRDVRGLNWAGIKWLALMTIASLVAAVLNPNGPELWIYPFFTLGSGAMQQYIQEWQSPNFHLNIFWPFALMLGTGVCALVASRRRPSWTDVLLFVGAGGAGLLSARHIPIFAIVSAPIIARYVLLALEGSRFYPILSGEIASPVTGRLKVLNWLILIVAITVAAYWIFTKAQRNDDVIAQRFPEAAVEYLQASGLDRNRGYNSYNWGGYLVYHEIPVFVDGRADVYGDDFLHYYRLAFDVTSRWREPLDDFQVDYVIMESDHSLLQLLDLSEDFREAYRDDISAVYVRND